MITIDILALVDHLEDLFHKGSRLPFSRKRIVDEQAFLDIIDQMRIAIPEEMRLARRINEDRERIVNEANDEAEQTLVAAQQHAVMLMSQQGIIQAAEGRAAAIEQDALAHRARLITEADEHCISVLSALEAELNELASSTHRGIQHLQAKVAAPQGSESESGEKGH